MQQLAFSCELVRLLEKMTDDQVAKAEPVSREIEQKIKRSVNRSLRGSGSFFVILCGYPFFSRRSEVRSRYSLKAKE